MPSKSRHGYYSGSSSSGPGWAAGGGGRIGRATSVARALWQAGKTIGKYKNGPGLRGSANKKTQTKTCLAGSIITKVAPKAAGSTFSRYTKYFKPQRGLGAVVKAAVPRFYTQNSGATLKIAQNTQDYHECRYYHDTDITAMYNLIQSGMDGSTVTTAADVRLYLESGTVDYFITNGAMTNAFIDIFEATCRRDQNVGATISNTPRGIFTSTAVGQVEQGLYELGGNATVSTTLGYSPFNSRRFCQSWKVDKWHTIELMPGKTHKHTSSTIVRRMIEKDRTSQAQNLGGLTRSIFIRARGQPVCDSTTDTNVALSEAELQIVMVRKEKIKVLPGPTGYATNLTQLSSVTSSLINDTSGLKTTYVHA